MSRCIRRAIETVTRGNDKHGVEERLSWKRLSFHKKVGNLFGLIFLSCTGLYRIA